MRKLMRAGALVALVGCESSHTPTVPSRLESSADVSMTAPSSVTAQQTTFGFCPGVQPFTASVAIVVTAGDSTLTVNRITSQFADQNGVHMPPVTLPAPVPATQFGSALVEARSSALFPVNVGFGCGTAGRGTIVVAVNATDAHGRMFDRTLNVSVR